jgi:hypothetical protein
MLVVVGVAIIWAGLSHLVSACSHGNELGGPVERRRRQDLSSRNADYGDFLLVVGGVVGGSEWPFITPTMNPSHPQFISCTPIWFVPTMHIPYHPHGKPCFPGCGIQKRGNAYSISIHYNYHMLSHRIESTIPHYPKKYSMKSHLGRTSVINIYQYLINIY